MKPDKAISIMGISSNFAITTIFLFDFITDSFPARAEKRINGITNKAEAAGITFDLLSSATHITPTKQIRVFNKLSLNTPRNWVANKYFHFLIMTVCFKNDSNVYQFDVGVKSIFKKTLHLKQLIKSIKS